MTVELREWRIAVALVTLIVGCNCAADSPERHGEPVRNPIVKQHRNRLVPTIPGAVWIYRRCGVNNELRAYRLYVQLPKNALRESLRILANPKSDSVLSVSDEIHALASSEEHSETGTVLVVGGSFCNQALPQQDWRISLRFEPDTRLYLSEIRSITNGIDYIHVDLDKDWSGSVPTNYATNVTSYAWGLWTCDVRHMDRLRAEPGKEVTIGGTRFQDTVLLGSGTWHHSLFARGFGLVATYTDATVADQSLREFRFESGEVRPRFRNPEYPTWARNQYIVYAYYPGTGCEYIDKEHVARKGKDLYL